MGKEREAERGEIRSSVHTERKVHSLSAMEIPVPFSSRGSVCSLQLGQCQVGTVSRHGWICWGQQVTRQHRPQ